MENFEIVRKAAMAIADVNSGNMELQPKYASELITLAISGSTMLDKVDAPILQSTETRWPKGQFASRFLHPIAESTALPLADVSTPSTFASVALTTVEVGGEIDIPDGVVEDNFSGEQLLGWIKTMALDKVRAEFEELALTGDTTSADAFLALQDGWIKRCSTTTVSLADTKLSKPNLSTIFQTLPKAFRKNRGDLVHFVGSNSAEHLVNAIGDRATPMGDEAIRAGVVAVVNGVRVIEVPLMPENIGTGSHCSDVLLTNPLNLIFGTWRQLRIEVERTARARSTTTVITARVGIQIKHEAAVCKATNVNAQTS